MANEMLSNSANVLKLNLSAIKKSDQYIVKILDSASQVALYKFNAETQAWVCIFSSKFSILLTFSFALNFRNCICPR